MGWGYTWTTFWVNANQVLIVIDKHVNKQKIKTRALKRTNINMLTPRSLREPKLRAEFVHNALKHNQDKQSSVL